MKNKFGSSSVFQKFVMGLTGLLLLGFVVMHLSGNLFLLQKEGTLFNAYAHKLESLGPLLYLAEVGLVVFFLTHAVTGIRLALKARAAKPQKYAHAQSKGGTSTKWGIASNNMAITGSLILVFLILHVIHFKYGAGVNEGYVVQIDGKDARDLHRLVVEQFKNPVITALYMAVMATLAIHLRHGVWSAMQSLGLTRANNSKKIYFVGGALGILLGVGFFAIPAYIYFFV